MPEATIYRCIDPYVDYRAGRQHVPRGHLTDQLPEGREHFYEPVIPGAIEQTTAGPGERRATRIPRERADDSGHVERTAEDIAEDTAPKAMHACDEPGCDFLAETRAGLASHRRTHE